MNTTRITAKVFNPDGTFFMHSINVIPNEKLDAHKLIGDIYPTLS